LFTVRYVLSCTGAPHTASFTLDDYPQDKAADSPAAETGSHFRVYQLNYYEKSTSHAAGSGVVRAKRCRNRGPHVCECTIPAYAYCVPRFACHSGLMGGMPGDIAVLDTANVTETAQS
jgi:hypothetical protein